MKVVLSITNFCHVANFKVFRISHCEFQCFSQFAATNSQDYLLIHFLHFTYLLVINNMSGSFSKPNLLRIALGLLIFSIAVASLASPWFYFNEEMTTSIDGVTASSTANAKFYLRSATVEACFEIDGYYDKTCKKDTVNYKDSSKQVSNLSFQPPS